MDSFFNRRTVFPTDGGCLLLLHPAPCEKTPVFSAKERCAAARFPELLYAKNRHKEKKGRIPGDPKKTETKRKTPCVFPQKGSRTVLFFAHVPAKTAGT